MNYISPATPVTAAHWNDIFMAADAWLTTTLGGLSACLCATSVAPSSLFIPVDLPFDRGFLFFDPATVTPAQLHPVAQNWFYVNQASGSPYFALLANSVSQPFLLYRNYDHNAVVQMVSSMAAVGAASLGVQKIKKPAWTTWQQSILPSLPNSAGTVTMQDGNGNVADNVLDCFLGVATKNSYPVTFNDITTAEHAQPLKPIDIFIIGAFTWLTASYNKYSVVRVHNCARVAVKVTFGSVVVMMAAGSSKCFRKLNGTWQEQGNYFHWMQPGDGRFLLCAETPQIQNGGLLPQQQVSAGASCFSPGIVADACQRALLMAFGFGSTTISTNAGVCSDPAQYWDASQVFNNPNYIGNRQDGEKPPPVDGWFPALTGNTKLGDSLVHKGQVLAFFSNLKISGSGGFEQFAFTGFDSLVSALTSLTGNPSYPPNNPGGGVPVRVAIQDVSTFSGVAGDTVSNLEIYQPGNNLDLVDISSPLVNFLCAGNGLPLYGAAKVGSSQTTSPKSLLLPWIMPSIVKIGSTILSTAFRYNLFSGPDSSGNYTLGAQQTVTILNTQWTATPKKKVFLPTNTFSDLFNWIASIVTANGIVQMGSTNILSSVFGPVVQWTEIWTLGAGFGTVFQSRSNINTGIYDLLGNTMMKIVLVPNLNELQVIRSVLLQDLLTSAQGVGNVGLPIWPRPDSGYEPFNIFGGLNVVPSPALSLMLQWNFPRIDELYQLDRWFYHDPALAPMMPNWTAYFDGSNYANVKYVNQLIGGVGFTPWWNDSLSQNEFNRVTSYYEANPIGVDTVAGFSKVSGGSASIVKFKTGISAMRTWIPGVDAWGPFAAWLKGEGSFSWQIPPDAVTGIHSGSLDDGGALIASIEAGSPTFTGQLTPNALMCQCEQFNGLASAIAALPTARYNPAILTGFLNLSLPDFLNTATYPTSGFVQSNIPGNSIGITYTDANGNAMVVWPRTAFMAWLTPSTLPDPFATYVASLGIQVQIEIGKGNRTTQSLSWISISDARNLFKAMGINFALDITGYPVSWVNDANYTDGGRWISDANGDHLTNYLGNPPGPLVSGNSPATDGNKSFNGWLPLPATYGGPNPFYRGVFPSALCILREGMPDVLVSSVPKNFVFQDPTNVPLAALQQLGNSIIPIVADNTVESAPASWVVIPGTTGGGGYDHVFLTPLFNSLMVFTPLG